MGTGSVSRAVAEVTGTKSPKLVAAVEELTANGKLDRKTACRTLGAGAYDGVVYLGVASLTDEEVASEAAN